MLIHGDHILFPLIMAINIFLPLYMTIVVPLGHICCPLKVMLLMFFKDLLKWLKRNSILRLSVYVQTMHLNLVQALDNALIFLTKALFIKPFVSVSLNKMVLLSANTSIFLKLPGLYFSNLNYQLSFGENVC